MIDKQEIRDYLTVVVKNSQIGDDESLIVTKLLDSMKVAELVVFLEDKYGFEFDAEEITPDNLDSINAIAKFVESKGKS